MRLREGSGLFSVAVEGNVGSGKSTMLKYFMGKGIGIYPEPVESWRNVGGENLLEKLYSNPERWSFNFQSYVQLTRLRLFEEKKNKKSTEEENVRIVERCLQSNEYVFLRVAEKRGILSSPELRVLYEYHSWIRESSLAPSLDLIVYLRTSPEVAHGRLLSRARAEEQSVPLDYIQDLHFAYEHWLIKGGLGPLPAPVLIIDADQDLPAVQSSFHAHKDTILGSRISHKL